MSIQFSKQDPALTGFVSKLGNRSDFSFGTRKQEAVPSKIPQNLKAGDNSFLIKKAHLFGEPKNFLGSTGNGFLGLHDQNTFLGKVSTPFLGMKYETPKDKIKYGVEEKKAAPEGLSAPAGKPAAEEKKVEIEYDESGEVPSPVEPPKEKAKAKARAADDSAVGSKK